MIGLGPSLPAATLARQQATLPLRLIFATTTIGAATRLAGT